MTTGEAHKKWKDVFEEIQSKKSEIDTLSGQINQIKEQLTNNLNESNNILSTISQTVSQIQNNNSTSSEVLKQINAIALEANGALEKVKVVKASTEEALNKFHELEKESTDLIKKNTSQTEKIEDILQKAAAGSLFNSFNLRKKEQEKQSKFWVWMIGISVIGLTVAACYIIWIAHQINVFSLLFLVRLAITFPLIYWLIFSTKQYNKARNFEEEYAFKSAISLSLEAYRDLLKKESGESTKTDVIPFITDAVSKIFSSPRLTISQNPHKEDSEVTEGFSQVIEKLTNLVKEIKIPVNIGK